jgi:CRISPR-associated endonuclease Cas2
MSVEHEVRRRTRNTKVQRAVLASVQVAGLLAWIMVAPNTLRLLGPLTKTKKRDALSATQRLIEKGLLKSTRQGLMLTPAGERYLASTPVRPKRWDKKWRVVIFDIPESRKKSRDVLRFRLKQIGFVKLQHSVWVYPYDCEELLTLLKQEYRLGKDVIYLVADVIERSKDIERHFGLGK